MGRRDRSWLYIMLFMFCLAVVMAVAISWFVARRSSDLPPSGAAVPRQESQGSVKRVAHLYFGDTQGRYLMAEQYITAQPADGVAFGRQLVQALIQGSQKGSSRTLPKRAKLRAFYVTGDGTAFVDFSADAFVNHPGGVGAELLSIYSIVNTLVLNVEAIRSVKFLIGGQEAATLAGHVDLSHSFAANILWVR